VVEMDAPAKARVKRKTARPVAKVAAR